MISAIYDGHPVDIISVGRQFQVLYANIKYTDGHKVPLQVNPFGPVLRIPWDAVQVRFMTDVVYTPDGECCCIEGPDYQEAICSECQGRAVYEWMVAEIENPQELTNV